jgi:hypothetical protein
MIVFGAFWGGAKRWKGGFSSPGPSLKKRLLIIYGGMKMWKKTLTALVTVLLFSGSANAAIVFEDNFDDPSQTSSQWMIFDLGYIPTPVWDFVPISASYSGDLGYRADTFD